VDFRALGHLEVALDDQALALGSHQQRAVLAVLVLCAGEVVSSDRLIESLWGERPPATAAKTVQVYISRLRKTLNGASTGDEPIVTADHGYVLRVAPEEIDVRVFERLLDEGRRAYAAADHDTAAAVMREALALWRGPALSDFTFDPFAAREIARLEELRLEALETRIDADLALGRHAELISELEALSAQHPLRERPRATLMLALYRCRREPEALAVYRDTRRMLVEELGVEPSPALQELHDAILRHDPALEPAAASAQSARGRRGRRPVAVAALGLAGGVAAVVALIAHHGMASAAVAPNSVAVIDPGHNTVVRDVGVGVRPGDISTGAGGLWVANLDDQSLSNIDPRTATLKRTLSIPGSAVDALAAGRDDVWTMDYARATATEIDPGFGDPVRRVKVGEPRALGAALPSPIAVAGGAVWASTGTSSVARIPAGSSRTA
jgi:DNA-binding SARP family transcriptional activator